MLEPNLNASGLACLMVGVVVLFIIEVVHLPIGEGPKRNPADSPSSQPAKQPPGEQIVSKVIQQTPLTMVVDTDEKPRIVLKRVLAMLAHLALVIGLIVVGWRHFERPVAGLSMATCYLLLPYARLALVDSGQLVPASLIIASVSVYLRPALAGVLLGLAAAWTPACLALIPLWAGFYRKRGFWKFTSSGLGVLAGCTLIAMALPSLAIWMQALGCHHSRDFGSLARGRGAR